MKSTYKYDVFCVMSFCKKRYHILDDFINSNQSLKCKIIINIDEKNKRQREYVKNPKIEIVSNPIQSNIRGGSKVFTVRISSCFRCWA